MIEVKEIDNFSSGTFTNSKFIKYTIISHKNSFVLRLFSASGHMITHYKGCGSDRWEVASPLEYVLENKNVQCVKKELVKNL